MKVDPKQLRKLVLDMVYRSQSGHIGGSFSIAELVAVLYSYYDIGGKDKLILSKGHAVPVIYAALNVLGKISDEELIIWLFDRCSSDDEYDRVLLELNMYEERGLYPLLKHLIYLVDYFRKNKVVWGVGRGSSVSSYVLYLIGIHRVDSLKYGLDITDFLK